MPDLRPAILIVSGGLLQLAAIEAARQLGLAVVMTDRDLSAPAMAFADEAHEVDIFDVEAHIRLVRDLRQRWDLQGVFCQGADVEVTVAAVAQKFGFPGIPVEAAKTTKNKAAMRAAFDRAGVVNPKWREVTSIEQATAAVADIGLPAFVKALDNSASRGTRKVETNDDLESAIEAAKANSTTASALVEQCYVGPEQSVEIIFDQDGVVHRLNIVDRIFSYNGGWALELGHVNPSALSIEQQQQLFALAEQAAAACGVAFGVFKADTIWTADGPRILEVASRLSGGFDAQGTSPISSGRNLIRAAMSLAVGLPLYESDLARTKHTFAAAWSSFPPPGRVVAIPNVDEVAALPGVHAVHLRTAIGAVVPDYVDCAARPAWIIAEGATYDEAADRARHGAVTLVIETVVDRG